MIETLHKFCGFNKDSSDFAQIVNSAQIQKIMHKILRFCTDSLDSAEIIKIVHNLFGYSQTLAIVHEFLKFCMNS